MPLASVSSPMGPFQNNNAGGSSGISGTLGAAAPWISAINPLVGGFLGLFGQGQSQQFMQDQIDQNTDLMQSNPFSTFGPTGQFRFGGGNADVVEGAGGNLMRQLMMGSAPGMFSGGLFNDPNFQNAWQGNDIAGALGFQNMMNSQQLDAGNFDTMGQINNMFNMGNSNLAQAGNTSGLVQQNLDASRALAQPFEEQLVNRFNNQEFMSTRGATSGASERQGNLFDSLFRADQGRILGAQQLGQADQQFLGNLGMSQMQQGFSGMNQNFNQYNQAHQTNQLGANNRFLNAMNLFGAGGNMFNMGQQTGLQAQQGLMSQDNMMNQMLLGLLNADNNRIGAQAGFAGANANLAQSMADSSGGFFDNIIGGLFG